VSDATALRTAIERLSLQGAIFLRAEYREPWAYESLPGPVTAHLLRPGSDRVILFHVVASGRCWVSVGDGPRHWAAAGDVIVLPYGDQHRMGGVSEAESVSIETFLDAPPWAQMPVLRHGADGSLTDVVCGYLHSRDPLFDPDLRLFPPVFVVRPPAGTASDWVRANIAFALAQTSGAQTSGAQTSGAQDPGPSSSLLPSPSLTRLPELLLVEVLRLHLATAPSVDEGWSSALRDPVVSRAIALLHRSPEHKWTVLELARASSVSRSLLDSRFREVLGRSPIRYLTEWRMHVAQDLLATTDLGVVSVARRVGYDAEEAFSRAFKRAHGTAPGVWRTANSRR
jgi:AraC-like DNA-binding protein